MNSQWTLLFESNNEMQAECNDYAQPLLNLFLTRIVPSFRCRERKTLGVQSSTAKVSCLVLPGSNEILLIRSLKKQPNETKTNA